MKQNLKKIWMLALTLVVIGMTLPVLASAGTINDTVSSTAVIEDERKYPDSVEEIPTPARFSKTPTGDKDKIVVTNDDVRYADEEGVERDPYSTHLFNVIVSEATEGPDGNRVTVHVEGRRGIEAVYWVKVVRIGIGEEVTGPPEYLWAEALDRLAGKLVLTDNIEPDNDTFTDSPEIGETFYCSADENKKGNITFELVFKDNLPPVEPEATKLNYSVTPLSPSCDPENPNAAPIVAGTWPEDEAEDPWEKRLSNIDPGRYILKVSGGYDDEDAGFKRQIPFVVVGIVIEDAGDFIVPHSQLNTIRYAWPEVETNPDSAVLKVYNNNSNIVRTIEGLPTSHYNSEDYAQYEWDGLDGDENPLKESDAPYELTIIANWQGAEGAGEVDADVKEWQFSFTIYDHEAFEGSGRSGIDPETVTPQLVTTSVEVEGGPVSNIGHYDVAVVDDDENPVQGEGPNALVKLMSGAGEEDHYLFYTTPSNFDNIFYTVDIETQEGGALDRARNEWDMDGETAGIQRKLLWQFSIDDEGQFFKVSDGEPGYDEDVN